MKKRNTTGDVPIRLTIGAPAFSIGANRGVAPPGETVPSKVLIADDSLKVQKELTQLLKGAGVEAVTVSNGEHAVRKLASVQPDLVLADIFMPVRTGYEVCDYIKSSEEFGHVAVLLLASKMEPYDEKEAQRVRADGKLEKPFADSAAVLATIQQHLQKAAGKKPAPAPPPIEEFAAAVPSTPEPEPEPEPYSTRPAPVSFGAAAPMGFSDVEEAVPPTPAPPASPESGQPVDLSQATILSTAAELTQRLETAPPPPPPAPVDVSRAEPREEAATPEPAPERPYAPEDFAAAFTAAAPAPAEEAPAPAEEAPPSALVAGFEPTQPPPASGESKIEKPELAAAWEMTGPQPGAPQVPVVGGFDSQWSGGGEAAAATEVPAAEAARAAAAAPQLDPAMVEQVVDMVLKRLSPELLQSLTRELVRPLAENLLKDKLKS